MQLTERVYLVASGYLGCGLTDEYDCNAYLVDGGSELALNDAGCGRAPCSLLEQVERHGFDPRRITQILLTHGHADHAGGAAALRAAAGAKVLAPGYWAAALARGDEACIGLTAARAAGVYPPDYAFAATPIDGTLSDGDRFRVGDLSFRAIATPGHCQGHLSFHVTGESLNALFSGDFVFHRGLIALLDPWDEARTEYMQSFAAVEPLAVESLFPGHLSPVLRGANAHIRAGALACRSGARPPSIT